MQRGLHPSAYARRVGRDMEQLPVQHEIPGSSKQDLSGVFWAQKAPHWSLRVQALFGPLKRAAKSGKCPGGVHNAVLQHVLRGRSVPAEVGVAPADDAAVRLR